MTILDESPLVTLPEQSSRRAPAPDPAPIIVAPPMQMAIKRGLDLVVATVLLVLLMPVMVGAALLILAREGRPVLFRQRRVGRDGIPFTMLKFRTMTRDAESGVADLAGQNIRTGPLFKVVQDPRITPVGRLLRDTSVDELPQLLNVIAGQMSLVGPRPALPHEVAQFDRELLQRHAVRPGITGLWQAVARDDPSFERYRRLDLAYVRGWTLRLDGWIALRTVEEILRSLARRVRSRT